MAWLMHYLDDYLTLGAPESKECDSNLNVMLKCCNQLGVPLKQEKVKGPTTCLKFLGIILDTGKMEMKLSKECTGLLMALLEQWQGKKRCRKKELLSLIRKLVYTCKVVRVRQIFLRQLIN